MRRWRLSGVRTCKAGPQHPCLGCRYAGDSPLSVLEPGRGRIVLAACWSHTRRKFYGVHHAAGSPAAGEAIRRIAGLYAIEKQIRGKPPSERLAMHRAKTRPLVMELRLWPEVQLPSVPQAASSLRCFSAWPMAIPQTNAMACCRGTGTTEIPIKLDDVQCPHAYEFESQTARLLPLDGVGYPPPPPAYCSDGYALAAQTLK